MVIHIRNLIVTIQMLFKKMVYVYTCVYAFAYGQKIERESIKIKKYKSDNNNNNSINGKEGNKPSKMCKI